MDAKHKVFKVFNVAVLLLILSALYGFLIRWNFTFPMTSFPYQNILQSHSHVAFLGWGYLVTTGIIYLFFVEKTAKYKKSYFITWTLMSICIFLMLISFPLGGYKVFSIVLLAVFGLLSYFCSYRLLKDIKGTGLPQKFIRYGIYYYLISSFATWFLAGVIVTVGKTDLYYNTVYFYLHFLYNGFFVFVVFGILFKVFENVLISINQKLMNRFFIFLNLACIPTYALSILWSDVAGFYNLIGFLGAMAQLLAGFFLIQLLLPVLKQLKWLKLERLLLTVGVGSYILKIILQLLSAFPYFVQKSIALKPYFIVGYLHLFTLGFMTVILLLFLKKMNFLLLINQFEKFGVVLFLGGLFLTEILFFTQGTFFMFIQKAIPTYNLLLFIGSLFMVLGIIMIFLRRLKPQSTSPN